MDALRKSQEAIQEAALAYPVKKLAPELDKAPSTLYDEVSLSPGSKSKLSFADALRIMAHTKDHRGFYIAAAYLGYALHKLEARPGSETSPRFDIIKTAVEIAEGIDNEADYTTLIALLNRFRDIVEPWMVQIRAKSVSFSVVPSQSEWPPTRPSFWERLMGKGKK